MNRVKQLTKACGMLATVFSICIIQTAVAQQSGKTEPVITDQDIYGFFNATENPFPVTRMGKACNPDSGKVGNLYSLAEYLSLIDDTTEIFKDTTMFTKADRAFIHKQMQKNKGFEWKNGEINGVNVIDGNKVQKLFDSLGPEEGWNEYYIEYKVGFNKFSVPLFSLDKKRCIVYRGYSCGSVYGLDNTNVFENRDGRWIIIKSCSPWVH